MSGNVPWSVNAVEPEAWTAARDAARRAGLSVGEWLETAIRENVGETRSRHARRRAIPAPDDRLEDIAEQLDELIGLAPDFAQASQQAARVNASIHRSLDALNDRIEALGKGAHSEPQIPAHLQSAIERLGVDALKFIRQALAEVQPAESFAAVERDLQAPSGKLDALDSKDVDHLAITRLQAEAAEIRQVLANALPSDALTALVEQIGRLVAKLDRVAAPGDDAVRNLVGALERRMEGLAGRLESAAQGSPTANLLETIGTRIDELQRTLDRGGARANDGLETMLRSLADKVDAAQARLTNLDTIECELSSLSSGLREVRSSVSEVAEQAARSAVRELAARAVPTRPAPRSAPTPEAIPATAARMPMPALEPKPIPRTAPAEPYVRAAASDRPAPPPHLDGELPADFPLEPGSGGLRPRGAQSAAERITQSEAALGTFAPKAATQETRASDFIAAARRAAQAANAKTARAPETKAAETPLSLLSAANGKTTRTVAIGLVSMLLIYGAIRYYDVVQPYLFTFSSKPSKVSEVAPEAIIPPVAKISEPTTPIPPVAKITAPIAPITPPVEPTTQPRPQTRSERDFAGVPPAGMLAPQPPPPPVETVIDPEETGSTTPVPPARLTAAPPNAGFTPQPPGELPASIGPASLRNAALAGDAAAAYEIGARWFDGRGVAPSGEQAQRWFEQAIASGSMHAAYRLGTMHEKGQGIPKNLNEARRLYLMAAEAGHAKAMHNLAVLHAEGIDGKPDMRTAARWFRLAADRGVRDSQYNLGVMYARGAGVTQNLAESYRWFALAAIQGDAVAGKKRDDVANRLDAQTLVAAKLAVQTWTTTPLDVTVNDVQVKADWQKAESAPAPRKNPTKN